MGVLYLPGGCEGVARVEASLHQLHSHDAEDEPEHYAHQEHIEDGGDG